MQYMFSHVFWPFKSDSAIKKKKMEGYIFATNFAWSLEDKDKTRGKNSGSSEQPMLSAAIHCINDQKKNRVTKTQHFNRRHKAQAQSDR